MDNKLISPSFVGDKLHLINKKTELIKAKLELDKARLLKYKELLLMLDLYETKIRKEKLKCQRFIEFKEKKEIEYG